MFDSIQKGWRTFFCPSRQDYTLYDIGPSIILLEKFRVLRHDFEIQNKKKFSIKCSFYQPQCEPKAKSCIIYLHGMNGSRFESSRYPQIFCERGLAFANFDFSACGMSQGEYITFGANQSEDTNIVLQHIERQWGIQEFGIWGRSMGAVTALLHSQQFQKAKILVLDSPFISLEKVAEELAKKQTLIPGIIIKGALALVKGSIEEKAGFKMDEVDVLRNIRFSNVPAMMIASKNDSMISYENTKEIYQNYPTNKELRLIQQDHNESRDENIIKQILNFFCTRLTHYQFGAKNEREQIEAWGKTRSDSPLMKRQNLDSNSQSYLNQKVVRESPTLQNYRATLEVDEYQQARGLTNTNTYNTNSIPTNNNYNTENSSNQLRSSVKLNFERENNYSPENRRTVGDPRTHIRDNQQNQSNTLVFSSHNKSNIKLDIDSFLEKISNHKVNHKQSENRIFDQPKTQQTDYSVLNFDSNFVSPRETGDRHRQDGFQNADYIVPSILKKDQRERLHSPDDSAAVQHPTFKNLKDLLQTNPEHQNHQQILISDNKKDNNTHSENASFNQMPNQQIWFNKTMDEKTFQKMESDTRKTAAKEKKTIFEKQTSDHSTSLIEEQKQTPQVTTIELNNRLFEQQSAQAHHAQFPFNQIQERDLSQSPRRNSHIKIFDNLNLYGRDNSPNYPKRQVGRSPNFSISEVNRNSQIFRTQPPPSSNSFFAEENLINPMNRRRVSRNLSKERQGFVQKIESRYPYSNIKDSYGQTSNQPQLTQFIDVSPNKDFSHNSNTMNSSSHIKNKIMFQHENQSNPSNYRSITDNTSSEGGVGNTEMFEKFQQTNYTDSYFLGNSANFTYSGSSNISSSAQLQQQQQPLNQNTPGQVIYSDQQQNQQSSGSRDFAHYSNFYSVPNPELTSRVFKSPLHSRNNSNNLTPSGSQMRNSSNLSQYPKDQKSVSNQKARVMIVSNDQKIDEKFEKNSSLERQIGQVYQNFKAFSNQMENSIQMLEANSKSRTRSNSRSQILNPSHVGHRVQDSHYATSHLFESPPNPLFNQGLTNNLSGSNNSNINNIYNNYAKNSTNPASSSINQNFSQQNLKKEISQLIYQGKIDSNNLNDRNDAKRMNAPSRDANRNNFQRDSRSQNRRSPFSRDFNAIENVQQHDQFSTNNYGSSNSNARASKSQSPLSRIQRSIDRNVFKENEEQKLNSNSAYGKGSSQPSNIKNKIIGNTVQTVKISLNNPQL